MLKPELKLLLKCPYYLQFVDVSDEVKKYIIDEVPELIYLIEEEDTEFYRNLQTQAIESRNCPEHMLKYVANPCLPKYKLLKEKINKEQSLYKLPKTTDKWCLYMNVIDPPLQVQLEAFYKAKWNTHAVMEQMYVANTIIGRKYDTGISKKVTELYKQWMLIHH